VRRQRPRNYGFTLIEVMVATAVLGIAATALFSLLSRSLSNLKKIEDIHHYQLAAENTMNRVLLLSSLPPGGKIEGRVPNDDARWVVTVTPWIPDTLEKKPPEAVMKIDVEIQWAGRAGQRSLKLETVKGTAISYSNNDYQHAIESALPQ